MLKFNKKMVTFIFFKKLEISNFKSDIHWFHLADDLKELEKT